MEPTAGIIRVVKVPGAELRPAARVFVLVGGIAFVASLGYFLYSYDVTFGRPVGDPGIVAPVAWNVLLFSAFALHHSVFAREGVRAWVARTWQSLERSVYVWVASLLLAVTCFLWLPVRGVVWEVGGPLAWVLRALQLAGLWVSVRSAGLIGIWELAGIQGRRPEGLRLPANGAMDSPLVAGGLQASAEFQPVGPYAWVRHPIYLGWFLIVFSMPTMTMTQLVFAVVSCAYVLIAIPLEERSLRRTSAGTYERYMRQVRWKLIPYVF